MATKKKMLQAAAGNAGGAGLNVEDVFSTYLWTGNNGAQTISNGVDLLNEGGLVWFKNRTTSNLEHKLVDTERGLVGGGSGPANAYYLESDTTDAQADRAWAWSFLDNGFSFNKDYSDINQTGEDYVSWTFRKAPKFFDVVTYTGTGSTQTISHSLGSVPAVMMVKSLDSGSRWNVYHKDASPTGNPQNGRMALNTADAWAEAPSVSVFAGLWNQTAPTDSVFTVGSYNDTNASGENFVAYLFAHNDGDGEFGPDGDADIIKCGSYTGGSGNTEIDLGFEPQWLMIKRTDSAEDWLMLDVMRGLFVSGDDVFAQGQRDLLANTSAAEAEPVYAGVSPQPNGFKVRSGLDALYSANGGTYIYIAIRRGPLAAPESGTEVFDINIRSGTSSNATITSNIVVDKVITFGRNSSGSFGAGVNTRLTSPFYLRTYGTQSQNSITNGVTFNEVHTGFEVGSDGGSGGLFNNSSVNYVDWMWKRAPGFFDVVAYTGNGTAGRTVSHNLTVAPEMMWVKRRDVVDSWAVFLPSILGNTKALVLDQTLASFTYDGFNNTDPSDTAFTLGNDSSVNASGSTYIAYLFASLDGISKVGSYSGNSSSQTIDCGFTTGARFVLIKASSRSGAWAVWDSARGITAGDDPRLELNSTGPETSQSNIDVEPHSSGFIIDSTSGEFNETGETYIFYAIA
jgi:hypothetical protein